jgi:CheY-like chemotaxis protein
MVPNVPQELLAAQAAVSSSSLRHRRCAASALIGVEGSVCDGTCLDRRRFAGREQELCSVSSMVNRRFQSNPRPGPRRILVVEDDLLVALMIEEMVRNCGRRVSGIAADAKAARHEFAKRNFDAVLLDLTLQDQPHPELADNLLAKGVPFAFVTGYDYLIEPRHEDVPLLQKPFTAGQLGVLLAALGQRDGVAKAS